MMNEQEARVLAQRFGTRMCDEYGDTHNEELYVVDLEDIVALCASITQRTWVGLTDDERMELYKKFTDSDEWTYEKAIEAKLKEKNT
jgi:hypothetical protein